MVEYYLAMNNTTEPTFRELLNAYKKASDAERVKTGRPGRETAINVIRAIKRILRECHIPLTRQLGELTRSRLDEFAVSKIQSGLSPISVRSYLRQLLAVTAHWARRYYAEWGLDVKPYELPNVFVPQRRYVRPQQTLLKDLHDWYMGLTGRQDGRIWFAVTMMLEFAMRNGDITRITWRNFIEREGRYYLHYMPHKTSLSSGRFVCWPVHPEIWQQFCRLRDSGTLGKERLLNSSAYMFRAINKELRQLGFSGGKASYELRKICIDHIYQKFGAEMASSISGDDIRTVMRYYADPSAVNVEGVRVVDLL